MVATYFRFCPPGLRGFPRGPCRSVRTRRIVAVCLDLIVVSILCFGLWMALLVLTFGLSLVLLPPLFPFVAFFYNGLTVSGRAMATPGMRAMDLEIRSDSRGRPSASLRPPYMRCCFTSAGCSRRSSCGRWSQMTSAASMTSSPM